MLNCKETSRLVSESLDHELTWWQRLNLWMHLSMCRLCSGFSKNARELHEAAGRVATGLDDDSVDEDVKLPADARERIKQALRGRDGRSS